MEVPWKERAFAVYREAFAELIERWLGKQPPPDVEFFVEEIKEALLDLKFAVINEQSTSAGTYGEEVLILLFELRLRSPEP